MTTQSLLFEDKEGLFQMFHTVALTDLLEHGKFLGRHVDLPHGLVR